MALFLKLRAEMARNHISHKEVADAAGVSTRAVWSWVNGSAEPSVTKAIAVTRKLFPTLKVEDLFDVDEDDA